MVDQVDTARRSALNERELWREMVRWSGGQIVEERGVLLVSGPSAYLRVAIRSDPRVDGAVVSVTRSRVWPPAQGSRWARTRLGSEPRKWAPASTGALASRSLGRRS
jgi:hypothetical protein